MVRFGIQVIGGTMFLFWLSWSLTLVMLSVVPLLGIAGFLYSRRARSLGRDLQDDLATNAALAGEVLGNMRHVRVFDAEARERSRSVHIFAIILSYKKFLTGT